ncbi:hypothetical protein [Streptomyces marincola]|uniref:Uncharacterized protein n=1 Tax=Streptomyces marincola TaxID=2878388 RepID=A0A1W7CUH0_9ACTN|nr:hypothetical protein [Streptomyces marincola]ARQ68387.1 hypothetical protein CAG99_05570 [Streptomyces marincola]UCM90573.1 hypothetical protein LC193_23005 [Streptomyces marincola]
MSFDEEWRGLQASARDELTRTRLNSGAGGGGDLEVHGQELTPVQEAAGSLADDLDRDGHVAQAPTEAAGAALRAPGLDTGSALADVAGRWQSQADALRDACLRIAGHIGETVHSHAAHELETVAALQRAGAVPASNPRLDALGGGA